jgi:Cation transporter/ATPase, N-terminus
MSDLRLFASAPEQETHNHDNSNSNNVLKKVSQLGMTLGDDDLRYAEEIATHGTRRERRRTTEGGGGGGLGDGPPPSSRDGGSSSDGFVFNENGLTTDEAQRRLDLYGYNALPEKVDPQWLLLVRILTQPMVRHICFVFVSVGGWVVGSITLCV